MWKGIWNHYRFSYKETTHFCLNYLNGKHFTWKNPSQIIWICVPDNLTCHSYESHEIHNLITDSIKMYIYFVLKLTDQKCGSFNFHDSSKYRRQHVVCRIILTHFPPRRRISLGFPWKFVGVKMENQKIRKMFLKHFPITPKKHLDKFWS